jgi:histidine ammonia-lyase
VLIVGETPLSIEDVVAVARKEKQVALPTSAEWTALIQRGADFLDQLLQDEGVIYGVTTGYGDSCLVEIPAHQVHELPLHLSRFHGCGMGQNLDLITACCRGGAFMFFGTRLFGCLPCLVAAFGLDAE